MSCRNLSVSQSPSETSASTGNTRCQTGVKECAPVDSFLLRGCSLLFVCQEAHEQGINAVRFSSSSDLLATGGTDRVIKVWDIRAGTFLFYSLLLIMWLTLAVL